MTENLAGSPLLGFNSKFHDTLESYYCVETLQPLAGPVGKARMGIIPITGYSEYALL